MYVRVVLFCFLLAQLFNKKKRVIDCSSKIWCVYKSCVFIKKSSAGEAPVRRLIKWPAHTHTFLCISAASVYTRRSLARAQTHTHRRAIFTYVCVRYICLCELLSECFYKQRITSNNIDGTNRAHRQRWIAKRAVRLTRLHRWWFRLYTLVIDCF